MLTTSIHAKRVLLIFVLNFLGGPKDPLKLLWNINIKADTAILLVARLIFKDGPFLPISGNTTMCAVEAELNY